LKLVRLTTNPLFGEIIAVAEPDFILSISPIDDALILNKPLPSPLNKDADIDDEILMNQLFEYLLLFATD
jgi:hypothetical protein